MSSLAHLRWLYCKTFVPFSMTVPPLQTLFSCHRLVTVGPRHNRYLNLRWLSQQTRT